MFSTKSSVFAACLISALAMGGAALAQTLVLRASGPSSGAFAVGSPVPGGEIALQTGDQLVIMDGGATRTLRGPGRFTTGGVSQRLAAGSNFDALVSQRTTRIARTGAVRSAGGPVAPRSPNIWYVDVDRSSNVCLTDFGSAVLWRADMSGDATMTLTRAGDGRSASLNWAAGQSGQPWPQDFPIAAGDVVSIARAGSDAPVTITFKAIGPAETPDGLAAALIAADCAAQLDVLVASLAVEEDTSGSR